MKEVDDIVVPVRKDVVVRCSPARAFWIFTREIDAWWPLKRHSVGDEQSESVHLEPRIGGQLIETHSGGRRAIWGTILVWDPPDRLVFISDVTTELDAAATAGCAVILCVRPGNRPQPAHAYPTISSFDGIA